VSAVRDAGINTSFAPKLMAADPKTKNKIHVCLDLTPSSRTPFGRVEVIHGRLVTHNRPGGGIVTTQPVTKPEREYPLFIQTHAESRERFLDRWPFSTANAAPSWPTGCLCAANVFWRSLLRNCVPIGCESITLPRKVRSLPRRGGSH